MEGKDPQIPPASVVLDQWTETIKLLHTPATSTKKPGVNDPADWAATIKTLNGAGLLSAAGDTAKYYDAQYQPK
jgi:NitT/TauT family transport system substrate-binding protein